MYNDPRDKKEMLKNHHPLDGCRECGGPVAGFHRICERCEEGLTSNTFEGNYEDLVDIFERSQNEH